MDKDIILTKRGYSISKEGLSRRVTGPEVLKDLSDKYIKLSYSDSLFYIGKVLYVSLNQEVNEPYILFEGMDQLGGSFIKEITYSKLLNFNSIELDVNSEFMSLENDFRKFLDSGCILNGVELKPGLRVCIDTFYGDLIGVIDKVLDYKIYLNGLTCGYVIPFPEVRSIIEYVKIFSISSYKSYSTLLPTCKQMKVSEGDLVVVYSKNKKLRTYVKKCGSSLELEGIIGSMDLNDVYLEI